MLRRSCSNFMLSLMSPGDSMSWFLIRSSICSLQRKYLKNISTLMYLHMASQKSRSALVIFARFFDIMRVTSLSAQGAMASFRAYMLISSHADSLTDRDVSSSLIDSFKKFHPSRDAYTSESLSGAYLATQFRNL